MNWATRWTHCIYCGVSISKTASHGFGAVPSRLSREHIYPAVRGGWLMVPCCAPCNSNRRDLSLYVWWHSDFLRRRREWAQSRGGSRPFAPPRELVRLYLRGRPVQRMKAVAR